MTQLQKVKDNKLSNLATVKKRNGYWMSRIHDYLKLGVDKTINEQELYESISADDVKAVASKILSDGNRLNLTMKPKK